MKTNLLLSLLLGFAVCLEAGPIHKAAQKGEVEKVKALLAQDAKLVNAREEGPRAFTPLHNAALAGKPDVAEVLVAGGADVNAKSDLKETPLHLATLGKHKAIVELLLKNKADANAKDNENRTPLHSALTCKRAGTKDVVELLLAAKADINARDAVGHSPLDLAKNLEEADVIALLKKNGAK